MCQEEKKGGADAQQDRFLLDGQLSSRNSGWFAAQAARNEGRLTRVGVTRPGRNVQSPKLDKTGRRQGALSRTPPYHAWASLGVKSELETKKEQRKSQHRPHTLSPAYPQRAPIATATSSPRSSVGIPVRDACPIHTKLST